MSLFDFFKHRSESGLLKQLDQKLSALLDRLGDQVANPGDQAPTKARSIYENVVDSQHLSAAQEYEVILLTLTALEESDPYHFSDSDLVQHINRIYVQRMRHEEMTGDVMGGIPENLAAKLLSAYQQAQDQGLSTDKVRAFLYARIERFKTLTELRQALAIVQKLGPGTKNLVAEAETLIERMIAPLK